MRKHDLFDTNYQCIGNKKKSNSRCRAQHLPKRAKVQLKRSKFVRNSSKAFPPAISCTTLYEHVSTWQLWWDSRKFCSYRGILKTIKVASPQPLTLVLGMLLTRKHWINLISTSNFPLGLYEHNPLFFYSTKAKLDAHGRN